MSRPSALPVFMLMTSSWHVGLLPSERLLCVTGEDKVARFDLIVAGEAGFHERLVARRFTVLEVSETPTARCGVLFCVLDHKLNVCWGTGYERLGLTKDFVVFLRRHVTVMQSGNDRAVWERLRGRPGSLNRCPKRQKNCGSCLPRGPRRLASSRGNQEEYWSRRSGRPLD